MRTKRELALMSFCSVNHSASCAESHLDVLFYLWYRALELRVYELIFLGSFCFVCSVLVLLSFVCLFVCFFLSLFLSVSLFLGFVSFCVSYFPCFFLCCLSFCDSFFFLSVCVSSFLSFLFGSFCSVLLPRLVYSFVC